MARPIWNGSLSFGLVNVPVRLLSATEQKDVSFHQREAGSNARVRYKRVAEGTDREVEYKDVVKGYELPGDKFVTLTQEEVESASLGRSRSLEISDFVDLAEIDPVYYEKSYYLAPREESAHEAYALLRDAMEQSGLAGVGSFVMRGKEYLAVIRPWKRVLVLETLLFADEVRDPQEVVDTLPSSSKNNSREVKAAVNLIEQLTTPWKPEQYHDSYRERLLGIVKDKAKGKEIEVEEYEPEESNVVDLMDALRRSVDEARSGRAGRAGSGAKKAAKSTGAKKAAKSAGAKKEAAKKSATSAGAKKAAKSTGGSGSRKAAGNGSGGRSRAADVAELSKQDLYDRASKLGIEGRSKMTRAQLQKAVQKAS
ncbi:DNA end-binding protein Ku [Actinopolymorpha cephalotaxi]|uniref:Non-homologous end joining protein Ku n=1 Tax=Actinopolymorpha cephalotaxi TaxID=504797 RepID=A0A1I2LQE0_9ACTN|nr:Ku protein [Actinopolymorpha cephalotaxi]NYH81397.1 DNA end-binding protein Ku [Actinopolymorpha cephalotaxi]SFF81333.1 DNA end-binding protein Ku [Actinopolymorpha cephalotaxi]